MRLPLRHLDDLSPEEFAHLENGLARFEAAWRRGERPALDDFLGGDDGRQRRAQLLELVHTDLEYRIKAGEPARSEDYLHRYPELADQREVVGDLFAAEVRLRCRLPRPGSEGHQQHFPALDDELATILFRDRPSTARDTPLREKNCLLGRYVLLEEIGSGSFGTVHKAFDSELRRTVALKVPHRGGVTDARFLREARSAAALRHPGIVAVHDAGQADGVWYLVSEFVAGQTLAQRLKKGRPSFRQAALWVADLADALAHAHRHGVIHRDVKPSNILLDAEGQPRLTDFGLARRDVADGTTTEEGQILGTPAYMSPEQARGEVSRIDARTDVYSLGVVLYELLTGELPFHGNNRMLLRQVLEEEPRPPRRINDDVPRDLETVCLKAMAKEPVDRYAAAAEFADDLRRFLQGQPVNARPVSPVGRLLRWVRRRPVLAGLSAALLLVAAVGFAGVFWQWRQAETHLAEADRQRDQAHENARQAHLAINDLISVCNDPLLERSDLSAVRRKLWKTGLQYYRGFLEQDENDPSFTDPSLRADTASAQTNLAYLLQQLGFSTEAETAHAKARDLWQRLFDEEPHNASYRIGLAKALRAQGYLWHQQGRLDAALTAYRKVIPLLNALDPSAVSAESWLTILMASQMGIGEIYETRGQWREARDYHELARVCGESHLNDRPNSIAMRQQLVGAYCTIARLEHHLDRADRVLQAHRRGVEIGKRLLCPNASTALAPYPLGQYNHSVGALHNTAGRHEYALLSFQESDRFLAEVLQRDPDHFNARYLQAVNGFYRGIALHGLGRREEAVDSCRRAHRLSEQLAAERQGNAAPRELLAQVCFWLGKLQAEAGRRSEAIIAFHESAALYGYFARQTPNEPKWRFMQGTCVHSIANQLTTRDQIEQAANYFRLAAALREGACQDAPNNLAWHDATAGTWHRLGESEERLDRAAETLTAYRRAIQYLRAAAKDSDNAPHQRRLREFLRDEARLLKKLG